jgi:hypothetical protein
MQGHRIEAGEGVFWEPGDYWKYAADGTWHVCTPSGFLGNLAKHRITEHDDGTITVSPSILVTQSDQSWHGYLERGVWREV